MFDNIKVGNKHSEAFYRVVLLVASCDRLRQYKINSRPWQLDVQPEYRSH